MPSGFSWCIFSPPPIIHAHFDVREREREGGGGNRSVSWPRWWCRARAVRSVFSRPPDHEKQQKSHHASPGACIPGRRGGRRSRSSRRRRRARPRDLAKAPGQEAIRPGHRHSAHLQHEAAHGSRRHGSGHQHPGHLGPSPGPAQSTAGQSSNRPVRWLRTQRTRGHQAASQGRRRQRRREALGTTRFATASSGRQRQSYRPVDYERRHADLCDGTAASCKAQHAREARRCVRSLALAVHGIVRRTVPLLVGL